MLPVAVSLMLAGCYTFTISQTPKVLEPGKTVVGAAGAAAADPTSPEVAPLDVNVYVRHGLCHRLDAGLRVSVISFGATGDVKYQLVSGSLPIVADLGLSYGRIGQDTPATWLLGVSPSLLVGDEHVYGGVRVMYLVPNQRPATITSGIAALHLVVGGTMGNKLRVMPELGILVPINQNMYPSTIVTGGCGVQYGF